jgi:hypothetical protein
VPSELPCAPPIHQKRATAAAVGPRCLAGLAYKHLPVVAARRRELLHCPLPRLLRRDLQRVRLLLRVAHARDSLAVLLRKPTDILLATPASGRRTADRQTSVPGPRNAAPRGSEKGKAHVGEAAVHPLVAGAGAILSHEKVVHPPILQRGVCEVPAPCVHRFWLCRAVVRSARAERQQGELTAHQKNCLSPCHGS